MTLQEQIVIKLESQFKDDLEVVMGTPPGRRVFSFLLLRCGLFDGEIKGNSRDFHQAGRRSVALDLIGTMDAIGIKGLDLRQKAEKEYVQFKIDTANDIKKSQ